MLFLWNGDRAIAFRYLKEALASAPILGHFDDSAPTEFHTDASVHGIVHVLTQEPHVSECLVSYASRLLSLAEKNYSIR